jgi:hypothetical protein
VSCESILLFSQLTANRPLFSAASLSQLAAADRIRIAEFVSSISIRHYLFVLILFVSVQSTQPTQADASRLKLFTASLPRMAINADLIKIAVFFAV